MYAYSLRPYQEENVFEIRGYYGTGSKAVLYQCPTGGGKTVVFSYITAEASKKRNKVLILVHRIELLEQAYEKITSAGIHCGIINSNYTPDPFARVQVASVQTYVSRMAVLVHDFDLIIIDECHHSNAGSWRKIIQANTKAKLLGVTATPVRTDGSGLGADSGGFYDSIVLGPTPRFLIDNGFLVQPRVFGPKHKLDFSDVDMIGGDFSRKKSAKKIDKPEITGDAVAEYSKYCPGAPCIVFCVNVEHAKHVAAEFRQAGFISEYVDGTFETDERKRILGGLGDGTMQVAVTVDLVSEGTDIPNVVCAILLRKTASLGLFIQQVGRALRPVYAKGFDLNTTDGRLAAIEASHKPFAFIFDHVGNCLTHGLPDDERDWSLDGKKQSKRSMKLAEDEVSLNIRQCPKCYAVNKTSPKCPGCGYIYVIAPGESMPKQVSGELRELTKEDIAALRRQRSREVAQARTYEDLLAVERLRKYKPGWAKHVWHSRGKKEIKI